MTLEDGQIDDLGPAIDAMNRAEMEKKAPRSPEAQVAEILNRLWNRQEATDENKLTNKEALILLLYGDSAGEQQVEIEMEDYGFEPDADVQVLLDKKRAQSNPPPIQ